MPIQTRRVNAEEKRWPRANAMRMLHVITCHFETDNKEGKEDDSYYIYCIWSTMARWDRFTI
jgi:hypothetical protein